jgi:osmotically-inducible protein OsmY
MAESTTPEPKHYLVSRIREALACDGRVSELEIDITVVGGRIFLEGEVATENRRRAIAEVAREAAPGYEIVNEVDVTTLGSPEPESLS